MVRIKEPKKKANPADVRIALKIVDEIYDMVKRPLPGLKLGRTEFDLSATYKGFFDRLKNEIRKRPHLVTEVLDKLEKALAERRREKPEKKPKA